MAALRALEKRAPVLGLRASQLELAARDRFDRTRLVSMFGFCHCLSNFRTAVGALVDEVDCRHAPMRFNISNVHRQQSYAAGADNRS
jgi:hypothetical protein